MQLVPKISLDTAPTGATLYYISDTPPGRMAREQGERMGRSLHVDPRDAVPIWKQIEHGVRGLVASGALPPGAAAPSVRDLSRELRVNPATVAKAYQRLTDAGVLTVRRGEGTYVSDAPPVVPKAERQRALREGAVRYASLAKTTGAASEEAVEELESAWQRLERGAARGGGR